MLKKDREKFEQFVNFLTINVSEFYRNPEQWKILESAVFPDLFEKFGIADFAEVKVANLSTGMKQKFSLVISIAHDPKFIIFDEPTNGLDVLTARVVTDYLQELKAQGKTILLSTHIFSLVEKLCTRVAIIIDGKLTMCDSLENVTKDMSLETKFFEIYEEVAGDYNA